MSNVFSFIKGLVLLILVLAVVALTMRVLEEKGVISCQWFRDHLGAVGTAIFGEEQNTTIGNILIEGDEIL